MMQIEKFKTLVHYICWRADNPRLLGATKLNKIIWFAEKTAFLRFGSPMTGAKFTKQERGPVPAAILPVLRELESDGLIAVRTSRVIDYQKKEYISLRDPHFEMFTSREISLLDHLVESICKRHTAGSISALTHDDVWDLAQIGEEIPMAAVLGSRGEICKEDIQWAQSQIAVADSVFKSRNSTVNPVN